MLARRTGKIEGRRKFDEGGADARGGDSGLGGPAGTAWTTIKRFGKCSHGLQAAPLTLSAWHRAYSCLC